MSSGITDTLKQILRTAQDIKRICGPPEIQVEPTGSSEMLSSIDLPAPPSLHSHLITLGLPLHLADECSEIYLRKANAFRLRTEATINESCIAVAKLPRSSNLTPSIQLQQSIFNMYHGIYLRKLEGWKEEALDLAGRALKSQNAANVSPGANARPQFNHYYVPFLEHYFAENPLPTHADKNLLAKKCGMTFRQIHVWFQNRRNRTRKDGQVFKRKPQREAAKLPLDTLIAKMPHSIIPEDQRENYVDSDASEYEWHYESSEDDASGWVEKHPRDPQAVDVFDIPAPPYAYPTVYPPEIEDEPFPEGWEPSFSPPQWNRRPAKPPSKRPPVMNFEEFIDLFSRMSVKEGPRKRLRKKRPRDPRNPTKPKRTSTPPPKPDRSAATIFITTKPLAAPLAAFVRPTPAPRRFLVPKPLKPPTVGTPTSRKRAFASPDPTSTPATLVATPLPGTDEAASSTAKSSPRRKIAPLPKRIQNSIAHRAITPAMSIASSSSSERDPSPSSSGSTFSKRIRLSSTPAMSIASSSSERDPSPSSSGSASSKQTHLSTPVVSAASSSSSERDPSPSSSGSPSSKRIRLSSDSSSASSAVATPEGPSLSLPPSVPPPLLSMTDFDLGSPSAGNDLFYNTPANLSQVERLQLDSQSSGVYDVEGLSKDPIFDFEQSFELDFLHVQS